MVVASGDDGATAPRSRRRLLVAGVVVAVVMVLYVLFATFIGSRYRFFTNPSEANAPTLQRDDRFVVETSVDVARLPRGAMVVHRPPAGFPDPAVTTVVKRIIGLPGETITLENGRVLVNGRVLDEPWLPAGVPTRPAAMTPGSGAAHTCTTDDPCVVPPGTYWVLGDNRTNSEDSRGYGPVAHDEVVGRVVRIWWPLSRAKADP